VRFTQAGGTFHNQNQHARASELARAAHPIRNVKMPNTEIVGEFGENFDPLSDIPAERIAEWNQHGVDAVEADLKATGGIRYVGGVPGTVQLAWRWVNSERTKQRMTDGHWRAIVLRRFYDQAEGTMVTPPVEGLKNVRTQREVFEICRQLNDLGLIEWKPLRGENEIIEVMAKITPGGVDAIENPSRSQETSSSVGNINIHVEKSIFAMREIGSTRASMSEPKAKSSVGGIAASIVSWLSGWLSKAK